MTTTSKPIELLVRPRGEVIRYSNLPRETYGYPVDSCKDLYDRIAAKSRVSINRIRITKGSDGSVVPNNPTVTIDDIGLYEHSEIFVKDLGPQIDWQTVFIIEYLGPLLIHPLIWVLRTSIFRNVNAPGNFPLPSTSASFSFALIMIHFMKREVETLYVHRFSQATMPVMNIFKNSFHYWVLAGLNIALFTYTPSLDSPTAHPAPAWTIWVGCAMFAIGEAGNAWSHLTLRNMRSEGGSERTEPKTGLFKYLRVTCPNYTMETLAWCGIWLVNRSLSTGLFIVVAVVQMALWAKKKEKRYRSELGDKYRRKRFVMIPGIW